MKLSEVFGISIILAGLWGYIANIVKLIDATHMSGMVIARAIGIFAAPFGAILGFL